MENVMCYFKQQEVNIVTGEVAEVQSLLVNTRSIVSGGIVAIGARNYAVFQAYTSFIAETGEQPTVKYTAYMTGFTNPTVRKAFRELKQLGLI